MLAGTLDAGGRDRTSRPRPRRRSLTMPRILSKRALRDRIQAAVLAYETGLVQLGDG